MKRYFPSYPLEERKTLWAKYLPIIQERFTDDDYAAAQESFASVFPDYESMTEYEGVPFDPNDRSQVALANMFGWDDSHWDDWYDEGDAMKDTIPTIKSMLKKSNEMKEEYDSSDDVPMDERAQVRERQRTRFGDKVTDEGGNSRLVHRANVADLKNFDQDINAPQGNVYDADKLKAPIMKSRGFREMVARKSFEKIGKIPDVEFMDSYRIHKAADEADFDEMAEGFADSNRKNELMEEAMDKYPQNPDAQENYVERLAPHGGNITTDADDRARLKNAKLMDKPYRKELSDTAQMMAPRIANNPASAGGAGEHAKDIAGYRAGDYGGRKFEHMLGRDVELERRLREGLINILSKNYNMDDLTAQRAADEYITGFMYGDAGPFPSEYDYTGYEGESDEEYAERMQSYIDNDARRRKEARKASVPK